MAMAKHQWSELEYGEKHRPMLLKTGEQWFNSKMGQNWLVLTTISWFLVTLNCRLGELIGLVVSIAWGTKGVRPLVSTDHSESFSVANLGFLMMHGLLVVYHPLVELGHDVLPFLFGLWLYRLMAKSIYI